MQSAPWLEIKTTDFLAALKAIKPTRTIKMLGDQQLQIGFVGGQVVFAVDGGTASRPAQGDWPGLATVKLLHLLSFLKVKHVESVIRFSFVDGRIHVGSARFAALWASNQMIADLTVQSNASTAPSGHQVRFKCPHCKKMQGVSFDSLFYGPMAKATIKSMVDEGSRLGHGFGCLLCGKTWANQHV